MTFGFQSLISISLTVFMVKQQLAQTSSELINAQIAFENAVVANRNLTRLLRNNDGHGVRFFAQPQCGAMTEAEIAIEILTLRQGKIQAAATMRSL